MPDQKFIHVYIVVLETSLALDLAGPAEALRIANRVLNQQGKPDAFALHFVGTTPNVTLSIGLHVDNLAPLPSTDELIKPAWVVILGQEGIEPLDPTTPHNRALIAWLKTLPIAKDEVEPVTVCAGSLLAYGGLLNHRKATTHHKDLSQLVDIDPTCQVQQDCIFVEDDAIASSAGVVTGIDLMVHKIAQHCGEIVAAEVAQWLVMPVRRTANDTQRSPLLAHRNHLHPALHRVQRAIGAAPQDDWTLDKMADIAHTSTRHLTRLFMQNANIAPMQYLKSVRLNIAQSALASGLNVTQAADIAGFQSDSQLRRVWRSFGLAGTPSTYQHDGASS